MDFRVFKFPGATGDVYADPLRLQRKLSVATKGRLSELYHAAFPSEETPLDSLAQRLLDDAAPEDKPALLAQFRQSAALQSLTAWDELIGAVRTAFDLGPGVDAATGKGVTDECCLAALHAWFDFCDEKKESADSLPTSPAVTDSPAS